MYMYNIQIKYICNLYIYMLIYIYRCVEYMIYIYISTSSILLDAA